MKTFEQQDIALNYSDLVKINVGGRAFVTTYTILKKYPKTRLGSLTPAAKEYMPDGDLYFFDRNPEIFNSILDLYRTDALHLPKHLCGATIQTELDFWQVDGIKECCVSSLFKFEDDLEVSRHLKNQFEDKEAEYTAEQLRSSKWNRLKNALWQFMDNPESSYQAKVYSVIYMALVTLTCFVYILSTHRFFRVDIETVVWINTSNETRADSLYDYLYDEYKNQNIAMLASTVKVFVFVIVNYICTLFFVIELLLRFMSCPARNKFFRNLLNIVDLIIVTALLGKFVINFISGTYKDTTEFWIFLTMRGCILLRLLRLFRFAKHFSGLKVVYLVLKASRRELGLLCMTFLITTSLFGGLIYMAELVASDSQFENMPIGIWWAMVTMTTVGYGDYVPVTLLGYIIGAVCGMCGLMLLSMPIAVIATNFNEYYGSNKVREKQIEKKKSECLAIEIAKQHAIERHSHE